MIISFFRPTLILSAMFAFLNVFGTVGLGESRNTLNLDGVWSFATDPNNQGEAEQWYEPSASLPAMPLPGYAPTADGTIRVPGVWDNQGYGVEREQVRHNYVGKAWYKRQVAIPESWANGRTFLVITGISRYSKTWINGHYLGEHIGFLTSQEYDVTEFAKAGQTASITIQVDSKQRWDTDAMVGCSTFVDYMDLAWGGVWGHVYLESRGDCWLSDLFLQPDVPGKSCTAAATVHGDARLADGVKIEVFDRDGHRVADAFRKCASDLIEGQAVSVSAQIPNAELWSPDSPTLYSAKLSVLKGDRILDTVESRFGMRHFAIDGHHLLLNGKRLFLRGYGDDHIYPEEMAMPSDKDSHLARLRMIKSYGFNHVRHHSAIMPPEYYDACDEVGMICTAEFPIAYSRFLPGTGSVWTANVAAGTSPAAAVDTYRREWSGAIKRHRNHPSIFCWAMGNELYGGIPLRIGFQKEKDRLDSSRFFVDSDGVWGFDVPPALAAIVPPGDAGNILDPKNDRSTLDLYFLQIVDPVTYQVHYPHTPPKKPVIVHELGNYLTFTRPNILERFQQNIKPFWLVAGNTKLEKLGLVKEAALWAEKSERLYALLQKQTIETLRTNGYVSGYHWWLFQDYWTTSNGLVDLYFRPKSISPAEVLRYNSEIALLQEGLQRTYRGHDTLKIKPFVSNYSSTAISSDTTWKLELGGNALTTKTVPFVADQGEVSESDAFTLELPDVKTPTRLRISAQLETGDKRYLNDWSSWVFPATITPSTLAVPFYVSGSCGDIFAKFAARPLPAAGRLSEDAVYATDTLADPRLLDAMDRGAAVLLVGPAPQLWPAYRVTFGTTWWKAGDSPQANHTGTMAYDHPVIREMAPDGWCDAGWFSLLEGANKYVLDNAPARAGILIRTLPSMVRVEESSVLFEVGVGRGCLIASGLNHRGAADSPENLWLLNRLLEYAASRPSPKAQWPASYLKCSNPK